jgi:hypothetical protein
MEHSNGSWPVLPDSQDQRDYWRKGTQLIVRELLMGMYRFKQMKRGLSLISTTFLIKRFNAQAGLGLAVKNRKYPAGRAVYILRANPVKA